MRLIDAHVLYDNYMHEMENLVHSTIHENIDLEALSLLCGAKLITDAPTIGGWISVKDRLPEEHESIFHKFLGTPKWSSEMWQQESDKVLVCVSFPDGTSVVTTGCLHNSDWMTTVSKALPQTVTHWMPLPETPKEVSGDD